MADSSPFKLSILTVSLLFMTACSSTSEQNLTQTATENRQAYQSWTNSSKEAQVAAKKVSDITELIAIEPLTALVNDALKANPNLQQTAIALQIAYAQKGITASQGIPKVNASFGSSKEESVSDSFNADVSVSWELDLWQKISDDVSAATADMNNSRMTYQGAQDLLAANIMRSWIQIQLQAQLIDIETKRLAVLESNETFILQRYRNGLGELQDLDNARSSSATTRATLVDYKETQSQNKRDLWVLLGANEARTDIDILSETPHVIQPLAGMPEQDLARRPDLQAAYFKIEAESYRTDVAYKALLPSINLTASLKDVASSPSSALFASPVWSLLGQITAPIFQGGQLREQATIAELTAEQAFWAYQEVLVSAVSEVESSLSREKSYEAQQAHLKLALQTAQRSEATYLQKYRQGLVNILDLLSVQQQTFDLQTKLTQTTFNRLTNRVDLGLALGLGVNQGDAS